MLTKRQNHLIDILNTEMQPMTGRELGQLLGVSDRTIRSDVDAINRECGERLIGADRRRGYFVNREIMGKQNHRSREMIPQTSQQRCSYLLRELLFKNREINLLDLQERVFVSGYSIENDLRRLREIIKKYPGLGLVRSKNHVWLSGREGDKRRLYKALLLQEMKGNMVNLNAVAEIWKDFDLLRLEEDFNAICRKNGYNVSELKYLPIMLYAGISIERMLHHNYMGRDRLNEERGKKCAGECIPEREYRIADELFERISDIYRVKRDEEEVRQFAMLLAERENTGDGQGAASTMDQIMEEMMDEICQILRTEFDIDLSEDEEFKDGIISHFRRIDREQEGRETAEWYLQELKRKYPLIFEMAVRVAEVINSRRKTRLGEKEISFLALYMGAACQRLNLVERYRAVAIIPNRHMISKPCVDKLMLRFGNRMEIVGVYSFFEEKKVALDLPDLILSTVPLKHHLSVPTVQISLFLNGEDESRVFQTLNFMDKKKYHKDFSNMMRKIMRRDLFHICQSAQNREEILNFLCDSLHEKGLSGEDFKKNVFRREELSSTSFVYGFAVPHAIEASSNSSSISIMILKEPVKWGEFNVSLVVLLALRESDNQLLKVFFDWLCNIVTDNNKFQELIHSSDYEEFMEQALC